MRFSVETWAPEYGSSIEADELVDASERVDATIERALADWAPITPPASAALARVLFVDGVRRIDARVWIHDGARAHPAVCASVAAGIVECAGATARVTDALVRRALIAPAAAAASAIETRHGTYAPVPTVGDDPGAAYLAIHARMTALEAEVVGDHDGDLVVFDGPLRGRTHPRGVGYVKTQHVQYVPDEAVGVLGRLDSGQRTPLMLIGDRSPLSRRSWYLRLPGRRSHPLSGVVRCELPATGPVATAIQRADAVSAALPRFASHPHKEPRAPQNLVPIAGLEHRLRHHLGDPLVLERALRVAAAQDGS
jgi:hypothetical protein